MIRKITNGLLVLTLLVTMTACGAKNKNASGEQMGGKSTSQQQNIPFYKETEIGSNSGVQWPRGSRVNSKGQLVVFDAGTGADSGFVTLDQDGNPTGEPKCSFSGNVEAFALDSKDNIYVLTSPAQDAGVTILSLSGEVLKTIELPPLLNTGASEGMGMIKEGYRDIAVGTDGNIYLAHTGTNIQVLDQNGQPLKTIGSKGYESIDVDGDGNIVAVTSENLSKAIDKIDPSSGKSIWSVDLSKAGSTTMRGAGTNKVRYSKIDNSIYFMNDKGITQYGANGERIGEVIDFTAYTILASGYNVTDMCTDADGNVFVTTSSAPAGGMIKKPPVEGPGTDNAPGKVLTGPKMIGDIKFELFRYSVQSGGNVQQQEVITVSVPVSDRMLEMAASKFQKDNPGYRVDIQEYPGAGGSDYETYLKNLNTQILSGKGPDIISVAGMPFENYVSKNVLADVGAMMENDSSFDQSMYYTNIIDAFRKDGKLYVLPADFTFNVLMANQAALDEEAITINDGQWTWDDFKSIAGQVTQGDGSNNRAAMPSIGSLNLLNLFTGGSYISYMNADNQGANFNSSGFISLLNTVKAFQDEKLTDSNIQGDMASVLEAAGRGAIVFYPSPITDYTMYGFMKAAFNDQLSLYNIPSSEGANGGTFTSSSLYAINRNSKQPSECWEFLKTLISDEIQTQATQGGSVSMSKAGDSGPRMGGFSINKSAQQKKGQLAIEVSNGAGMTKMMMTGPSGTISLTPAELSQTDIDYINEFIAGLNTYANVDQNINKIIEDETKAFFAGDKSAEETAKLIQDRASIYLGE